MWGGDLSTNLSLVISAKFSSSYSQKYYKQVYLFYKCHTNKEQVVS